MSGLYYYNQTLYSRCRPQKQSRRQFSYHPCPLKQTKAKQGICALSDNCRITSPYSPALGLKKRVCQWKAKKKSDGSLEKGKFKRGVFHFDDGANAHHADKQSRHKQYVQHQLRKTQDAPPKVYKEVDHSLPSLPPRTAAVRYGAANCYYEYGGSDVHRAEVPPNAPPLTLYSDYGRDDIYVNGERDKKMSAGRRVNKIQKQLEYYLSPKNMETDWFLRQSMDQEGWIDIAVILSFKRMKYLQATKELVVEAAFHSNVVEVNSKTQDKIQLTKYYWKDYDVTDVNDKEKPRSNTKQRKKEMEEERKLDEAELNKHTYDQIASFIEHKWNANAKAMKR